MKSLKGHFSSYKYFFIFIVCAATHLPGLFNPILDYHGWAQTLRASIARNYAQTDMNFFHPQVDYQGHNPNPAATQFPLYSYLVALLYKIFGVHDCWGRVVSLFFASFSAVALYFLAGRLLAESAAFGAALIYCFIPVRIYFMRAFMPESMAISALLAGFYCVLRWTEQKKFFPYGWASALLLALACLLKLPYTFLLVVPVWVICQKEKTAILKNLDVWLWISIIGLSMSAWYYYTTLGIPTLLNSQGIVHGELNLWVELRDLEFWSQIFLSRFPELLTTYAGLLFFLFGLGAAVNLNNGYLAVWLCATVVYTLASGHYSRVHQYASVPFAPVNACIIAQGAQVYWQKWSGRKWARVLFYFLLLSIPIHAALRIKHWYRLDEKWVLRAALQAAKISTPQDLFYINSSNQPFHLYHLKRKGWVRPIESMSDLDLRLLPQVARFYLTPNYADWNAHQVYFKEHFKLLVEDPDFLIYDLRPAPKN